MTRFFFFLSILTLASFELTASAQNSSVQIPSLTHAIAEEARLQERFNEKGELVGVIDEYGNETTYTYDSRGLLLSVELPAVLDPWDQPYRPKTEYVYNLYEGTAEIFEGNGAATSITFANHGQPVKIAYPDGSFESFQYFMDGSLQEKVMRDGSSFGFEQDNDGRIIRIEKRAPSGKILQAFNYSYEGGRVRTVSDGKTFSTQLLYDEEGLQIGSIQETADGIRRVEWTNGPLGTKKEIKEWYGPQEGDFFLNTRQPEEPHALQDALLGREKTSAASDFIVKQTLAVQNSLGQTVRQEEQIDGHGVRCIVTYDALRRPEKAVKYNSLGNQLSVTDYRYDRQGNIVLERQTVCINGQPVRESIVRRIFDSSDRLLSITEGSGYFCKTTRYRYNLHGQLEQVVKPDGIALNYTYDDGRLECFEASDGSFSYRYEYDGLNRVSAIHDLNRGVFQTRSYNAFHELTEELQSPDVKVGYRYDGAGRQIGLTLPDDSKIDYHYEGALLSSIERSGADSYVHSYEHDESGRLLSHRLLKGLGTVTCGYDSQGRLAALDSPWWSQKIDDKGYDPYGRLAGLQIRDAEGGHCSQFSYTDDGQLAEEKGHSYAYDSLYNRIGHNGRPWEVNPLNQLVKTAEAVFTYDGSGNLIGKRSDRETIHYSYDALDRMIRAEYPEQTALTYSYDSFHRRVEQKVWRWNQGEDKWDLQDTERFIYDGFKEIGKIKEGRIVELRVLGQGLGAEIGAAVAIELNGKLFAPLHDFHGSVSCLIDAESGEIAECYRYSAYGQETLMDGRGRLLEHSIAGNPWRYCSKRVNEQTGLVSFGMRDYSPELGRWMTPDPLFFYDTSNIYAFAKNDPVNHCDHYGLFSFSHLWDNISNVFFNCFKYLQLSAHQTKMRLNGELKFHDPISDAFEKIAKILFGETFYFLLGPHFEETEIACYGQGEISNKVRVTFINGILNTRTDLKQSLQTISESHGNVNVHYVFRPTEGWTWDISRSIAIKLGFLLGFRSLHAHLLAQLWRTLITDMGGPQGGGTILHYAHSLGGSETDRARELLTPEEQKMIRVNSFGSSTLIRNEGYQYVVNHASKKDGVHWLDPFGHIRNFFDPDSNVRFYGSFFDGTFDYLINYPCMPADHLLNGATYGPILKSMGESFLIEFGS